MRTQTKPRIHHISDTPTGDVWIWRCNRPRCMEWTHTPNISVAPRGIGYASRWDRAARDLEKHLEEHPVERPAWLWLAVLAWIALVLAGILVLPYAWGTVEPEPAPSYEPDECTAEYVEQNGICLTWEDYHGGQSTYR